LSFEILTLFIKISQIEGQKKRQRPLPDFSHFPWEFLGGLKKSIKGDAEAFPPIIFFLFALKIVANPKSRKSSGKCPKVAPEAAPSRASSSSSLTTPKYNPNALSGQRGLHWNTKQQITKKNRKR